MATSNHMYDTTKNVVSDTQELADSFKNKLQNWNHSLEDKMSSALEKTKHAKNTVSSYVRHNPYKSIGLAFLAGYIYSKIRS